MGGGGYAPSAPPFQVPLLSSPLKEHASLIVMLSGVPEAFKGRGGELREKGIQGGGSGSPQSRERSILPCSAIFVVVVNISIIKTSKNWCTLALG